MAVVISVGLCWLVDNAGLAQCNAPTKPCGLGVSQKSERTRNFILQALILSDFVDVQCLFGGLPLVGGTILMALAYTTPQSFFGMGGNLLNSSRLVFIMGKNHVLNTI